jgi:hypothetical protein
MKYRDRISLTLPCLYMWVSPWLILTLRASFKNQVRIPNPKHNHRLAPLVRMPYFEKGMMHRSTAIEI